MADGWIKLWRKSIDSGLIKNHKVWIFWTYCLMKANHEKDYKCIVGFQEVILQPGEFVFGLKISSKETGLSIQNIRTCLVFLKKCQNLTIKSTNKFSVITIINWATYQQIINETNKQSNTKVTSNQQASNNIQEPKNKRTKEIKEILLPEFDKFWSIYNKKTDRKKCFNKFIKLKDSDREKIFQTLQTYIDSTPETQFRKNPVTYLNNESWNDEINNEPPQRPNPTTEELLS